MKKLLLVLLITVFSCKQEKMKNNNSCFPLPNNVIESSIKNKFSENQKNIIIEKDSSMVQYFNEHFTVNKDSLFIKSKNDYFKTNDSIVFDEVYVFYDLADYNKDSTQCSVYASINFDKSKSMGSDNVMIFECKNGWNLKREIVLSVY